ncbi:MAG: restriction endonuclease subunit M, partial [Sulfurovaceae bacterium]|nr:restriction endonuclease subunit M [Sulfurovaceae bacterium]
MAKSIEPNIADLANGWLKSYGLDYKLEQEELTPEIDTALNEYFSKGGGKGGNRPDAKLLLKDEDGNPFPVLIEYKGLKGKLEKLDSNGQVANKNAKHEPHFNNIKNYAVNGAVHYANALLHYTDYKDIIAIGITGYRDEIGEIKYQIGVYFVSTLNLGAGQKVDDYPDFSFLAPHDFNKFTKKLKELKLNKEDFEFIKEQREREIDANLVRLNNDIYQNEKGLGENDRVYLVASIIIATIGVKDKVKRLEKSDLKSLTEEGKRDGDILINKIIEFLNERDIPKDKKDLIVRTLANTLLTENINKIEKGKVESQLKRIFVKVVDD